MVYLRAARNIQTTKVLIALLRTVRENYHTKKRKLAAAALTALANFKPSQFCPKVKQLTVLPFEPNITM